MQLLTPVASPIVFVSPTFRLVGTVETRDGRFYIRFPFNPRALDFIKSLPHSIWMKSIGAWKCDATPLAAFKLAEVGFSLDEEAEYMADLWVQGQLPAKVGDLAQLLPIFKTKPWRHQQRAMAFALNRPATILDLGMGCGKSLTTVCLLQAWQSRMNLVICPKSVVGVWRREFHKHCGTSHQVVVLEGSSRQKANMLEQGKLRSSAYAINTFVINYESSWREFISDAIQATAWDSVVCDESHRIKEMSSNQSKFAATLAPISRRRLALTGTLMPRGEPIEVLGQARFIEPGLFGTTKKQFQDKFCIMSTRIQGKVEQYKELDEFTSKLATVAFRIKSEDVLTLPPIQHITIPVTLSSRTRSYYEVMKNECVLELANGEVTAKNAAIKVMRLHQIACGHSKTEDGDVIRLGNEKQEVLQDMIEDIAETEPIVVFCKFTEDLRQVEEVAKKLKRNYGEISGSRKDITEHSTMPDNVQIMGVQYKAGGTGIDLTSARYAFWFSTGPTHGEFDQSNARVHRPGQERPTFIYHLAAESTVDVKIYKSLQNQKDAGLEILSTIDRSDDES